MKCRGYVHTSLFLNQPYELRRAKKTQRQYERVELERLRRDYNQGRTLHFDAAPTRVEPNE